jgi:hypothetical protein
LGGFIAPILYRWIFKIPVENLPTITQNPEPVTNSDTAQRIADAALGEGGFKNTYIDRVKKFIEKIGYEVGNTVGSFGRGIAQGVVGRWEPVIREGARQVDQAIDRRNNPDDNTRASNGSTDNSRHGSDGN